LKTRGGSTNILAARRSNTVLKTFPGIGHNINEGDPSGFTAAVAAFLSVLPRC
jgi:hypothetical protein